MLNFFNSGIIDINLLEASFDALKNKYDVTIITGVEKDKIYEQTIQTIRTPNETKRFSFENLFKIKSGAGNFYIAQCAIDFGYPPSQMGFPTSIVEHKLQLIGIAKSAVDLGNTFIRPETKVDKFISHFMHHDIDFAQSERFSDAYFITSDKKELVQNTFNKIFLDEFSKYENLLLATKETEIYLSFSTLLTVEQGIIVSDVFGKCSFLSKV